jgi:hypothetical protein
MNIDMKSARYIINAIAAIDDENALIETHIGNYCPECDENINSLAINEDAHILYDGKLLIGCEGYFLINPNLLGIYSPQWSFWKDDAIS